MSTARVALVTGGAKRVGKGIVSRLHADGYSICLHYNRSREEAEAIARKLNAVRAGSVCVCAVALGASRTADGLSLADRCRRLVDLCYDTYGRLDVLVNNASMYCPTPLLADAETDEEVTVEANVSDLLGSNTIAPFFLTRTFARRAVEARRAAGVSAAANPLHIVNLVDAMTSQPLLHFSMYTMAKHALVGLTKASAVELAAVNIRVNAVAPGLNVMPPTLTDEERAEFRSKVPLGHHEGSVKDIAAAVSFLISTEAAHITGTTINVDGGWSLTRA